MFSIVLMTVQCSFRACVCARVHLEKNFSYEFSPYSSHQWGTPDRHIEAKGHMTRMRSSTVSTFNTSKLSELMHNPCYWNSADYPCVTSVPHSNGVPISVQSSIIITVKTTTKKITLNMFYMYFFIHGNLTNKECSLPSVLTCWLSLWDAEYSSPSEAGSVFMESMLCC
jgi:hypothetical protein